MGGLIRGLRIHLSILILITCFVPAIAQDMKKGEKGVTSITETAPGLRTLVTIDAEDAYLPSVLAILAARSGFNIVTGPGVSDEERISIHVKDAPIEEAMNLVVRAAGLSYEVVGNSFLVAESKKLKEQVGQNSYVISLQYANAEEVQDLLKDFQADIKVDFSGNKLLIITTPKIITDIERVIKAVDVPALQITLSARLIEVSVEDEERLGINWSLLSTNTTQYFAEGPVAPVNTSIGGGSTTLEDFSLIYDNGMESNNVGKIWRSQPIYAVALDWMMKNSMAEVLTQTKVVTMNSKPATIELLDIVPYVTSAGGVGGQISVQRDEVGIKLSVVPQVNTDGYITVDVAPEVSSIFEFIGPESTYPRIVKRSAKMTVRVKNHESIVIGGLMGMTARKTKHKVPFFGDLPFFGSLFRYNVTATQKTDLIIEITPHILVDEYTYVGKSADIGTAVKKYEKYLETDSDQPVPDMEEEE